MAIFKSTFFISMLAATSCCMYSTVNAFVSSPYYVQSRIPLHFSDSTTIEEKVQQEACYYRAPATNQWQPRIPFDSLQVGQALNGTVVQELLNAKTGPKLFFDVGVCRKDKFGEFQICNAMMRLGGKGTKPSVTKKRATRLRRKQVVELLVSRIFPHQARFEVVTADTIPPESPRELIPASSLQPGQELVGTVTQVLPFGVFVDVGANRRGLLHIKKVADLYQRYIDKERGLEEAGLERGARIRVAVLENERKRLFLDFTEDVKQEAAAAIEEEAVEDAETLEAKVEEEQSEDDSTSDGGLSEEEAAAWAAFAALGDGASEQDDYDDQEEEDDYYDEDKDIEDALGLGSY